MLRWMRRSAQLGGGLCPHWSLRLPHDADHVERLAEHVVRRSHDGRLVGAHSREDTGRLERRAVGALVIGLLRRLLGVVLVMALGALHDLVELDPVGAVVAELEELRDVTARQCGRDVVERPDDVGGLAGGDDVGDGVG